MTTTSQPAALALALVWTLVPLTARGFDELLPLTPASTLGWAASRDLEGLRASFDRSGFGRLLADPALAPFIESDATGVAGWLGVQEQALGIELEEFIRAGGQGLVGFCSREGDEGLARFSLIQAATAERGAALLAAFERHWSGLDAKPTKTALSGGLEGRDYRSAEGRFLAGAALGPGWLAFSDSQQALQQIAQRAGQPAETLPELGPLAAQLPSREHPESLAFYGKPFELWRAQLSTIEDKSQRAEEREDYELAQRHFGSLRAVAGRLQFGGAERDVEYEFGIWLPQPQGVPAALRFVPADSFAPAPWLHDDISTSLCVSLSLDELLEKISPFFNEAIAKREGYLERLAGDIRSNSEVDLQSGVLSHLGPRFTFLSRSLERDVRGKRQIDSDSVEDLMVIEVRDEAKLRTELTKLFDGEEFERVQTAARREPYLVWMLANAEKENEIDHICLLDGHLVVTSSKDWLYQLLRRRGEPKLGDATDFQDVARTLGQAPLGTCFGRSFSRLDRDFLAAYEMLRQGRIEESNSDYAKPLMAMLEGRDATEFQKLPPFSELTKYLGYGGFSCHLTPESWIYRGFVKPRAGATP